MMASKEIIAINKDEGSPILQVAEAHRQRPFVILPELSRSI